MTPTDRRKESTRQSKGFSNFFDWRPENLSEKSRDPRETLWPSKYHAKILNFWLICQILHHLFFFSNLATISLRNAGLGNISLIRLDKIWIVLVQKYKDSHLSVYFPQGSTFLFSTTVTPRLHLRLHPILVAITDGPKEDRNLRNFLEMRQDWREA